MSKRQSPKRKPVSKSKPKDRKTLAQQLYAKRAKKAPPKPPAKPIERRRMGANRQSNAVIQAIANRKAQSHAAWKAAQDRAKRGEKPVEVSFKMPDQRFFALLVRTSDKDPWHAVKAYPVHDGTPEDQIRDYRKELRKHKLGWEVNGYFGPNATFSIGYHVVQGKTITY